MSKVSLDLKDFKHVKSDKHSTTLQHKSGHKLTLAHKGLSKEAQAQLAALSGVAEDARTPAQADEVKHQQSKVTPHMAPSAVPGAGPGGGTPYAGAMAKGGEIDYSQYKNPELAKKGHAELKKKMPSEEERKKSKEFFKRADYELKRIGHPGSAKIEMAEGGEAKKENKLDYAQIRKEKREMNVKEANQPIKPKHAEGGKIFMDEGGKVPAPNGGGSDEREDRAKEIAQGAKQSGGTPSDSPIATGDWSHIWKAEGGDVHRYADGTADAGNDSQPEVPHPLSEQIGQLVGQHGPEAFMTAIRNNPITGNMMQAYDIYQGAKGPVGDVVHTFGKGLRSGLGTSTPEDQAEEQQRIAAMQPPPQPQPTTHFNSVTGQMEANEPQAPQTPSEDENARTPASEDQTNPEMAAKIHGADNYGNPADEANPPGSAPTAVAGPKTQEQHQQDSANEQLQHAQDFMQDYAMGHITPKHVIELSASPSTAGKVGTLLTMALAGFGAGLSHQPNMLLDQLNKEITNDMTAQQNSATNVQNLMRVNQQGLMATANVADTMQNIKEKAWNLQRFQQQYNALAEETKRIQAMPEGPDKQQKLNTLAMMGQMAQNQFMDTSTKLAIADAQARALYDQGIDPQTGAPLDPEQHFQNRMRTMRMFNMNDLANTYESHHLPGFQGSASGPIDGETRKQVEGQNEFLLKAKQYIDFAKKNSMNWANLNIPDRLAIARQGAAMAADLQGAYRRASKGGVYKEGEQNFIERIIPSQPASWQASFNQIPKVEQLINNVSLERQGIGQTYGLRPYPQSRAQAQQKPAIPEGSTGMYQGKPVIRRNGVWVPQ